MPKCPGVKAFFLFGVLALQLLSHEGGLWPQTAERERGEKRKKVDSDFFLKDLSKKEPEYLGQGRISEAEIRSDLEAAAREHDRVREGKGEGCFWPFG